MTVVSRLYDNYSDATRAVSELERAGIPHSDISIVANNAEGWYSEDGGAVNRGARADRDGRIDRDGDGRIDRDRDGVDDRAEGAAAGAGIRASVNLRDRAALYQKSGWSRFDPAAPAYTEEQIRNERELYRRNP